MCFVDFSRDTSPSSGKVCEHVADLCGIIFAVGPIWTQSDVAVALVVEFMKVVCFAVS